MANRKRSGVQGKAVEYHIDSLPDCVKMDLVIIDSLLTSSSLLPAEPLRLWVSIFTSLTNEEQEYFTTWLIRNGVKELTRLIQQQEQNFRLMNKLTTDYLLLISLC